ncbi:hypothetical protein [Streptomyces sp. NPDC048606]|uniref:hypothetical protein n=1 Tax=Streptomyces sp. NPDC048606 TaxID=3154726 RepID=UPI00342FCC63
MVFLLVLATLALTGALYVARGFYLIGKAKRLTARAEAHEAETARLTEQTEADAATARDAKGEAARALGFAAPEDLNVDRPRALSAEQLQVLDAVRAGHWETAAQFVELTGDDWEERWQRVLLLSRSACDEDDAWLLAWRAARPTDPTAAVVAAETAVQVAWNVRGSARASHTSQEQFRLFHQLLGTAQRAAQEAQRLADPADPLPYMVEQAIAMGLGYSHERYRALWAEITDRAPRLLFAHTAALQYWCRKWRGSHELALEFARGSAALGAPGELLTLLPLIAYFEQEYDTTDIEIETWYKQPEIVAATDAALQDLADADPLRPGVVWVRHMLAFFLFWQDRDAQAVEQFRHIDGYIGSMPWTYAEDPRKRYTYARDWAVDVSTPAI